MILSIVTGTHNRISSLARMMQSARDQLLRGMDYEFVVVDAGSSDGTLPWLRSQADVRLIEHGERRGAIKAFCEGARAARGEYVVLANDDITFKPWSLLRAIVHLDSAAGCAAVAFADNRTSIAYGDGRSYRVETVPAINAAGQPLSAAYAQVGMFRRELGEAAGWWGDQDDLMRGAWTYGGDNYLSARLWEMGYTVDAVPGCAIEDGIAADNLRAANGERAQNDSRLYWQRYPIVRMGTPITVTAAPRLRMLHLPIYEPGKPGKFNKEAGLTEALAKVGTVIEVDYVNALAPEHLPDVVSAWQPDLMITQMHGVGEINAHLLATCRNAAPNMTVVNWNGDAHEKGLIGAGMLDLLRYVDLQLVVNAKVLPVYAQHGIRAAYWQVGYKDPVGRLPDVPAHDVLFQGNQQPHRGAMVAMLRRLKRLNVGIYGNWPHATGVTHYDFAMQAALSKNARIVIGDIWPDTVAFTSNRLYQTLAAGGFMLQQHAPKLEHYTGLVAGVHYIEWTDVDDLKAKIAHWLKPEQAEARERIRLQGQAYVRAMFSFDAQVRKLFNELLPLVEDDHATV